MSHDAYYFGQAAKVDEYTDPAVGDMVLILHDDFRGIDGEFAAGIVQTLDPDRPDDAEVRGADPANDLAPGWFKLLDMALISKA